jgi:rare lipoprotein A
LHNIIVAVVMTATPAYAGSCGGASWYALHSRTASGEMMNPRAFTTAHRSLKFGTKLRVTHKGRSVVVKVNDRGPFVRGRILDLSKAAAHSIGMMGTGKVCFEIVK